MTPNKKSQMEIMGLVIVVILLIIGVLFALKFVVLKEPSSTREEYTSTQLASNFGIAMMSTSTSNCKGTDVKTLLIDCAEKQYIGGGISCGNGIKSCAYVNQTIASIINETLVPWKRQYYIKAGVSNRLEDQIIYFHSESCSAEYEAPGDQEIFFLPITGDILKLTVFICR